MFVRRPPRRFELGLEEFGKAYHPRSGVEAAWSRIKRKRMAVGLERNDEIHGALWALETPREAFQRKLPPETLLGLYFDRLEAMA